MNKAKLGKTDLEVSNICFGTGSYGESITREQGFDLLDRFIDAGGNFIDTASVYCRWIEGAGNSSEQYLGKWLKQRSNYNKVVIATKGGHYDLKRPEVSRVTREAVRADLEESLTTLGLDHIDFYWLHRDNPELPAEEIIDMMEGFTKEGKIRFYGASNYSLERLKQAGEYCRSRHLNGFQAVSNMWSLAVPNADWNLDNKDMFAMDRPLYQWHKQTGMPSIPYTSGAKGFFAKLDQGRELSPSVRQSYYNNENLNIYSRLKAISRELNISVYALSLAWLTNQPFQTIPVASISRPEQLDDFITASECRIDPDEIRPD